MLYLCIDHPSIACQDVEKLAGWYCRHLGMQIVGGDGKTPPCLLLGYEKTISAAAGGAVIELMPARDAGPRPDLAPRTQPGLRHLAFRVSNFQEARQKLQAAGVKFFFDPVPALGGGKVVSFRDPEGNELQIVDRSEK